jgi:hypothetical protein
MSFHYLEEPAASSLFLLVNQINTVESIPEHIKEIVSSSEVVRASLPIIIKGQQMGEIKQGDPLSLALAFWGAIQGIAEVRLWFPDAPVPDSRCIVDLLKKSRE